MQAANKPYIVGIAGGSASGKTSFLSELSAQFPAGTISIISQDNYYVPKERQQTDDQGVINFDLPTSINREEFHRDLLTLMRGESLTRKEYTFNNAAKEAETIVTHPSPILVMEGLFIFHYEEISDLLDLKVYLDARDDVKLQRRIVRDSLERGYDESMVRYQWNNHVVPAYQKYLRPHRDYSDIVITNNTNYDKGLAVLVNHLKAVCPVALGQPNSVNVSV